MQVGIVSNPAMPVQHISVVVEFDFIASNPRLAQVLPRSLCVITRYRVHRGHSIENRLVQDVPVAGYTQGHPGEVLQLQPDLTSLKELWTQIGIRHEDEALH